MQFPEELQPDSTASTDTGPSCLNEVQFPEELQHRIKVVGDGRVHASMKCSSRRNCSTSSSLKARRRPASMKCSSRRNCSLSC